MSNSILFLILVFVGCLASVSSDIYAPSLVAISKEFDARIDHIQWSMAVFMMGLSLSQLIYGPLSEGIGRKRTLIIGLVIACFSSALCIYVQTIEWLLIGRFVQGFGMGACATMWRSIFRDRFKGAELAQYSSYLTVLVTLIIPAAPALGGYLQEYYGWRSSFEFIFIYSVLSLVMVLFLYQETNVHHHKSRLKQSFIFKTYKQVLCNKGFMGFSLCTFLTYGAFFSWYNTGPVLLIKGTGLSPVEFGWFTFFAGGGAMALAAFINARVVKKVGIAFMLRLGWGIMFSAGVLLLISYFIYGVHFMAIAIPFVLFYFGATFIWPGCFSGAFQNLGNISGYAGSVYGTLQIAGAAVIGSLVSYLPDQNQIPLAFVFLVSPFFAWRVFEGMKLVDTIE